MTTKLLPKYITPEQSTLLLMIDLLESKLSKEFANRTYVGRNFSIQDVRDSLLEIRGHVEDMILSSQ